MVKSIHLFSATASYCFVKTFSCHRKCGVLNKIKKSSTKDHILRVESG